MAYAAGVDVGSNTSELDGVASSRLAVGADDESMGALGQVVTEAQHLFTP